MRLAAVLLVLLIALQCGLWLAIGRASLEGAVLKADIRKLIEHLDSNVERERWPEYFYLCPTLEASLTSETQKEIESLLESLDIKVITVKNIRPDGRVSPLGSIISTICLETRWTTPVLATVDIRSGYAQDYVVAEPSAAEVYLFALGVWFKVDTKTYM